jgi:hypothetical protein
VNSLSHNRRPNEEREARASGREEGRSLYARRRGARRLGRRASAGPWPACTTGTGSWRHRRTWSRACGRPRPGAAPRPSSSSATSPPPPGVDSARRGRVCLRLQYVPLLSASPCPFPNQIRSNPLSFRFDFILMKRKEKKNIAKEIKFGSRDQGTGRPGIFVYSCHGQCSPS